ncbi:MULTISPECIES: winged helix-turn-helix transcriptional regulator [Curtobacterium]|uniref:winged helix-turn-helix transcriptional regulator n=1 Tax=Curtobacterium TaxID=2034 RepID=UPI00349F4C25|nr:helix-turn-helix transcriptional regulator [Curtobacterium flaccumfaciens pv. basellae]
MSFSAESWPECGIARFLTLLEGPWATLIVRELLDGPLRFTDLKAALPGVSAHTLTSRLRRFETYGIVTRTVFDEMPPRVEYQLTGIGQGLRPVLDAMNAWAATVPQVADDGAVPVAASCVNVSPLQEPAASH